MLSHAPLHVCRADSPAGCTVPVSRAKKRHQDLRCLNFNVSRVLLVPVVIETKTFFESLVRAHDGWIRVAVSGAAHQLTSMLARDFIRVVWRACWKITGT